MLVATDISIDRSRRRVLADVSLSLHPGQLSVIAGPNGAGKSTVIKALSGELAVSAGAVTLDGVSIAKLPANALAGRRAVVPQATVLSFPFTVLEVVRLGSSVPGFSALSDDQPALAALAAVELTHLGHRLTPSYRAENGSACTSHAPCASSKQRGPIALGHPFCCWMSPRQISIWPIKCCSSAEPSRKQDQAALLSPSCTI